MRKRHKTTCCALDKIELAPVFSTCESSRRGAACLTTVVSGSTFSCKYQITNDVFTPQIFRKAEKGRKADSPYRSGECTGQNATSRQCSFEPGAGPLQREVAARGQQRSVQIRQREGRCCSGREEPPLHSMLVCSAAESNNLGGGLHFAAHAVQDQLPRRPSWRHKRTCKLQLTGWKTSQRAANAIRSSSNAFCVNDRVSNIYIYECASPLIPSLSTLSLSENVRALLHSLLSQPLYALMLQKRGWRSL